MSSMPAHSARLYPVARSGLLWILATLSLVRACPPSRPFPARVSVNNPNVIGTKAKDQFK
jgi:hypothetical protein